MAFRKVGRIQTKRPELVTPRSLASASKVHVFPKAETLEAYFGRCIDSMEAFHGNVRPHKSIHNGAQAAEPQKSQVFCLFEPRKLNNFKIQCLK